MATRDTSYRSAVGEAASALIRGEDANWELARLTFENTLSHNERNSEKVTMEAWCADVRASSGRRFSRNTGATYRRIWKAHAHVPVSERPSWTEAYYETTGDSREAIMERHSKYVHTQPPEQKRETFAKLAEDPDVLNDPSTRQSTREALEAHDRRQVANAADRDARDPVSSKTGQRRAVQELQGVLARHADAVNDLLTKVGEPTDNDLPWLLAALERSEAANAEARFYVEHGETRLDAGLRDLAREES